MKIGTVGAEMIHANGEADLTKLQRSSLKNTEAKICPTDDAVENTDKHISQISSSSSLIYTDVGGLGLVLWNLNFEGAADIFNIFQDFETS